MVECRTQRVKRFERSNRLDTYMCYIKTYLSCQTAIRRGVGILDTSRCHVVGMWFLKSCRFTVVNALPCLGPLAPRGAVGARHDGLPRQLSPLMPRVCMVCVSANDLPAHSANLSIHFFLGLPLLRLPSTVPCSITLVRPSDLVTCPYHFSFAVLQLPGDLRAVLYIYAL